MIEDYFQLDQQPFKISTDPQFYFDSERHRKALSYLQYGLQQAEGFVVITGDAGVGKTTLVEQFCLETENAHILTGTITAGHVEPGEIIDYVLSAYRIDAQFSSYPAKHDALENFLIEQHRAGRHVLLIVDEAQNLSPETLEELRALSGISLDGSPLLQTFLLGQTAFKSMLAREAMEQFRQRVIAACHLPALDSDETAAYIDYRLAVAGWEDEQSLFTDKAHNAVYHYTGGVPRNINKLCARLLLQVALDKGECVTEEIVSKVIADLEEETLGFSANAPMPSAAPFQSEPVGQSDARLPEAPAAEISAGDAPAPEIAEAALPEPAENNVVPLKPALDLDEDLLPEVSEEEVFGLVEEQAAANSDAAFVTLEERGLELDEAPESISRPLSAGVSSVLDRLQAKKANASAPVEPKEKMAVDSLLIPSIDDIEDEVEEEPQSASLREVAEQIAAHVDETLEGAAATEALIERAEAEETAIAEEAEEELPIITHIDAGASPELNELKSDLAGFISELRESLMTVENSMSVVSDRVDEVAHHRMGRHQVIQQRLGEIDTLLKEMRGET